MNPAATSDPTRETTAMMIETMSTIFAVDFDICENHVVERIVGRLSPQGGSGGCCGQKGTLLGSVGSLRLGFSNGLVVGRF